MNEISEIFHSLRAAGAVDQATLFGIQSEFPAWQISLSRLGMWSAFWQSDDTRTRRYLVTGSSRELLEKLRAVSESQAQEKE